MKEIVIVVLCFYNKKIVIVTIHINHLMVNASYRSNE